MKDQLIFSTTLTDDSDNVGAYLRAGTDGDLISSGDGDADNVANTFEGIDTRGFLFGYDSVGDNWDRVHQTSGALHVFIDDGDFEVAVNINAERAEDSAHTTGDTGNYVLTVREDTLSSSTDTDGDYQSFKSDSLGRLYTVAPVSDALLTTIDADTSSIATDAGTTATNTTTIAGAVQTEDTAHTTGDTGYMSLAVRNDTLATLADTDGDYAPLQVDASGALYTNITNTINVEDAALANTAIANTATSVGVTATDLVGTDLTDRKYAYIYNSGNKKIFVGGSGVTTAAGFPVSPGSYLELRAGASIDLHAISTAAAQDTRVLELS